MRPTNTLIGALCGLIACVASEPFEPSTDGHTRMEVEAIPYDLLGSTKLFFSRLEPAAFGTISLDGSSGTAEITYPARGEWVAVHPTTRMITYMSNQPTPSHRYSEVWVRGWANAEGQPLGGPGGSRYDPSWSPDGARVIYTESDQLTGSRSLVGNRIVSQLPTPNASDRQVLWSGAEGCEFANSPKQNVAGDLAFIIRNDCTFMLLSIARHTPGAQHEILYTPSGTSGGSPIVVAWSPSGGEIAFAEEVWGAPSGTIAIKVMAADGSNLRTVASVANGIGGIFDRIFSLCWARDGSRLFFDRPGAQAGEEHIYTVALSGGSITPITTATDGRDRYLSCG